MNRGDKNMYFIIQLRLSHDKKQYVPSLEYQNVLLHSYQWEE